MYYFISKGTSLPMRFTLIDDRASREIIELFVESPSRPGFQAIRLTDYNVVLNPGVQYRWFVSVIEDADTPSKNPVAGGAIECCPEDLPFIWEGRRCDQETVDAYARGGIWYDAFACLSQLIEADPNDHSLQRLRYRLLTPSGLKLLLDPAIDLLGPSPEVGRLAVQ
jgi:hypothetical protein